MENINSISDDDLIQVSHEIDQFFIECVMNHGVSPSQLTGIVMARLLRMHEFGGDIENFYKLIDVISTRKHEEDRILQ